MKQLISKIIYKTTIITLVLGFFIQTISLFPFYVFASTSSNFEEININSVNNVDEENVRLLYEIEDLISDFLKVFRRTDGKLETSSESYNGSLYSRLEYQYDDFGRISSILLNGEESKKILSFNLHYVKTLEE